MAGVNVQPRSFKTPRKPYLSNSALFLSTSFIVRLSFDCFAQRSRSQKKRTKKRRERKEITCYHLLLSIGTWILQNLPAQSAAVTARKPDPPVLRRAEFRVPQRPGPLEGNTFPRHGKKKTHLRDSDVSRRWLLVYTDYVSKTLQL